MIRKRSLLVGLVSVLGLASLFTVASDALACVKITGGKLHYCSTTRTYGTWSGSLIIGASQFGDTQAELTETVPGLFFDAKWATSDYDLPGGQSFPCTYDKKPAFCKAKVECKHFAVGTCQAGLRTSYMTCPTTPENGSPGCKGEITVRLTGGAKFEETGLDQQTFPFEVNHNIDTNQCNQQFPRINKVLDQKVIGKIVQGGCTDPWSDQDPVLSAAVRNDLNEENPSATYIESTDPWVATALCAANPSNGFPTGACSNDGGAWITVGNPDPEEGGPERLINAEVCAASAKDLTCGDQITSVDKQQVQPGPAPKECKLDNAGNCTCRCARCNKAGTLVNLGGGTSATFVLADPKGVSGFENRPWAAICAVTVTGN